MSLERTNAPTNTVPAERTRHSDVRALRPVSADEIRRRYLTITAEQLLEEAMPILGPEKYAIVFDFVVNHVLMPPDRAARDEALEVLHQKMKSVTIMGFAANLGESVELVRLANDLDTGLVAILESRRFASASLIDASEVDRAILEEGRPAERRRQVELLCNNIRFFHTLVNTPLARFVLPTMKSLASAIGVAALRDQIDVGYRAGKAIDDVEVLCADIEARARLHFDVLFGVTSSS